MNTRTATATTAARLLCLRFNDALRNSRPIPEHSATHFWSPDSGGGSVIVGADGTYLRVDSSTSWDQHLSAYAAGQRSRAAG
ncbi:hypothetical protein [Arthrobacter methylotrophus]|uniref:Uncharacterized protein n=1 Tax=Arthrobacter methylotrophus TaxID=121291 RepID=A0ABV5UNL5_9MICC